MKKILLALFLLSGSFMASAWENFTIGGNLGFGSFNGNSAYGGNLGLSYSTGNGPAYGGWGGGYIGSPILPYGPAYQSMLGYGNFCTQLPQMGITQPFPMQRYPIQQPLLQQLYRPSPFPIAGGFNNVCAISPCGGGMIGGGMIGGGMIGGGMINPCMSSPCGGGMIGGGMIGGGFGGGVYGSGNIIASLGMYLQGTSVMPIAAPRCQSLCPQVVQQRPVLLGAPRDPNLVPRSH